jgi:hypothetical protein
MNVRLQKSHTKLLESGIDMRFGQTRLSSKLLKDALQL